MKLTEKQKRFADYYIETGNGAEAARRAGYKGKNHDNIGTENLRKLAVKEYIESRNKELESERIATMTEVKEFWTQTFRDEMYEMKDRLKASEFIAKTNGAFIEKTEISGTMNVRQQFEKLSDEELAKIAGEYDVEE